MSKFKIESVRLEWTDDSYFNAVGCIAHAEVSYTTPHDPRARRHASFRSIGLYGIDPDAPFDEKTRIEHDQLSELAEHLGAFGIYTDAEELNTIHELNYL